MDMFSATKGINTHKGAIFTIGILCAALGRLSRQQWTDSDAVLKECAAMTKGLPAVREVGLPYLKAGLKKGLTINDAGCGALLALMAAATDTNIIARSSLSQIDTLLEQEGISRDANLDYICAMYDENYQIIATGSCFSNTLRCFAVSSDHQGEGLLNQILTHLIDIQYQRGNLQLFLYTKISTAKFFKDLGFYEIARVDETLVFMENRRNGFAGYLSDLSRTKKEGFSAALVMNANPFTLGHQYLVEKAASECDTLHVFIVSEDASLVPFSVRKKLVLEGTSHLPNVICHDSGPYIISNATFPSYFLKDEEAVIKGHAKLDLMVFTRIADVLSVTRRYVGEERNSQVTGIYNQIMAGQLPLASKESAKPMTWFTISISNVQLQMLSFIFSFLDFIRTRYIIMDMCL